MPKRRSRWSVAEKPQQAFSVGARGLHLRRCFLEVALLLALGSAGGLGLNAVRRDPLPYDLPASLLLTESGVRAVFLAEAHRHFASAQYVFVDAREEGTYRAGHIEGALSLPVARFDELYPELQLWAAGQPLLVYSGTRSLLAADELARRLKAAGEERVLLLAAGYEAWAARGLPVEAGNQGCLDVGSEGIPLQTPDPAQDPEGMQTTTEASEGE